MGRIIVEQHVSADGFAAGPNGQLDWVDGSVADPIPMTAMTLTELENADAILLGTNTYNIFITYWPLSPASDPLAEPINRLPKHVVSSTLAATPWGEHSPAILETDNAADTADRLTTMYKRDIIVWGSLELAGSLLEAGCVDQIRLRVAPVALGSGTPFWNAEFKSRPLSLVSATPLTTGQVVLVYDVN